MRATLLAAVFGASHDKEPLPLCERLMSPYDLTTLVGPQGLARPALRRPARATQTLAALITAASRSDLRRAEPASAAASEPTPTPSISKPSASPEAMAGAAGQLGDLARDRRPPGPERRSRRLGRLRAATRRSASRQAGRRRSILFGVLSTRATESRRLLPGWICRARRDADGSRCAPVAARRVAPYGPWGSDLGVVYAATGRRAESRRYRRRRRANIRSAAAYTRSPPPTPGQCDFALLRLRAAGHRAGGARTRRRALSRRRADRAEVEIARRAGDHRLRRERVSAPVLAMLQPYMRVAL